MNALVSNAFVATGPTRDTKLDQAIHEAIAVSDPDGEMQTDRKGQPATAA